MEKNKPKRIDPAEPKPKKELTAEDVAFREQARFNEEHGDPMITRGETASDPGSIKRRAHIHATKSADRRRSLPATVAPSGRADRLTWWREGRSEDGRRQWRR